MISCCCFRAIKIIAVAQTLLFICGCAHQGPGRSALKEAHMDACLRLEMIRQAIQQGQIKNGMKKQRLVSLIGEPDKVIRIKTDYHYDEQLVYEDKTKDPIRYYSFHIQDGKLIDWQQ